MLNGTNKTTETDETTYSSNGSAKVEPTSPDAQAAIASLEAQIADLKKQFGLARGTRPITPPAAPVVAPKETLGVRIEATLRAGVYTTEELAREVDEPVERVRARIKDMRKHLADVGTSEEARWAWRIGDETSSKELRDLVARLIEGVGRTTAELAKITGARMPRVNGVLVDLQRNPEVPIYNIGSDFRAKWLILPKRARFATLPPKGAPKR